MKRFMVKLVLGILAILLIGTVVHAEVLTLADANSVVQIDPTSQDGMKSWTVEHRNYDAKQWFWYRIGSSDREYSLDTLPLSSPPVLSDTDTDGENDTAYMVFSNNILEVTLRLQLLGGDPNSGWSDIAEQIKLKNLSSNPIDLHFFQYNNYLLSDPLQDTVHFYGSTSVEQKGPAVGLSEEWNYGSGSVTGHPFHEASVVPATLNSLNDDLPTTLSGTDDAGPGNVSWAFQWDATISHGGQLFISKDKILQTVPEPSTLLLLLPFAMACLVFGWQRRK
jgi:hypothetical protein